MLTTAQNNIGIYLLWNSSVVYFCATIDVVFHLAVYGLIYCFFSIRLLIPTNILHKRGIALLFVILPFTVCFEFTFLLLIYSKCVQKSLDYNFILREHKFLYFSSDFKHNLCTLGRIMYSHNVSVKLQTFINDGEDINYKKELFTALGWKHCWTYFLPSLKASSVFVGLNVRLRWIKKFPSELCV